VAAPTRRTTTLWRIAFVLYALALTVGTHWPNLTLSPEVPVSDKSIHFTAFGTLTILLWLTRWIRSRIVTGVIVMVWAAVDEVSQGLPGVHRTVSIYDLLANWFRHRAGAAVPCGWRGRCHADLRS